MFDFSVGSVTASCLFPATHCTQDQAHSVKSRVNRLDLRSKLEAPDIQASLENPRPARQHPRSPHV